MGVGATLPLADAVKADELMEGRASVGRIVLTM